MSLKNRPIGRENRGTGNTALQVRAKIHYECHYQTKELNNVLEEG